MIISFPTCTDLNMNTDRKSSLNHFVLVALLDPQTVASLLFPSRWPVTAHSVSQGQSSATKPFESRSLCADHIMKRLSVGTWDKLSAHTKTPTRGQHLLHLDTKTLGLTSHYSAIEQEFSGFITFVCLMLFLGWSGGYKIKL